jgi:cyclopropane-fatty-acyl-phospholipid synthase
MQLAEAVVRATSSKLRKRVQQRLHESKLPIRLRLWNGDEIVPAASARAEVAVRKPHALLALARANLSSLAKSYVEQEIDLAADARTIIELGQQLCASSAARARTLPRLPLMRHTRASDRRAIGYHYDVSNDFYRLWLDRDLVYSCAYFKSEHDTLDAAQRQKLDHLCRKLALAPGERLLDIGCGWGGLIMHAAQHYGAQALGITLSRNQHDYAVEEIRRRGLADRCEVRLMDYRDVPEGEPFDKIVSVGMFEHVGVANFPVYFGKIYRLLKAGGLIMNHGITTTDPGNGRAGPDTGDFIDEYVFPDGELAHVSTVMRAMSEQGLECVDAESLRPHYARTLWHWVSRLESRKDEAIALVGEKKFRIWQIYMAGSAWAFERGWLSLYQLLAGRADASGRLTGYPGARDYMYA